MKKMYLIIGLLALMSLAITAQMINTRDKIVNTDDKTVLSSNGISSYTITEVKCTLDKCDDVCIIFDSKFSPQCYTPYPYNIVCSSGYNCTKVLKTPQMWNTEIKNFEDITLNNVLVRSRINDAKTKEALKQTARDQEKVTLK